METLNSQIIQDDGGGSLVFYCLGSGEEQGKIVNSFYKLIN